MIDIHTHILPGVDDGATNREEMLDMARSASAEGITTLIATPHHANGRYMNRAVDVIERTRQLNEQLVIEGIPITVMTGQEIRVHDDLLDAWTRKELLPLSNSSYVLIELPTSSIPKGMNELIHELKILGLQPIIAHPERNVVIMQQPERLADLISRGVYAQVTTHSLLGHFGRRIEKSAWTLCRSGLIHIVSSDAHHAERRGFRLREAYDVIRERMGESWENYFRNNALCVMEDRSFTVQPDLASSSEGLMRRLLSNFIK